MKRFVVTGGAGFIGSKLSEYLKEQDHEVIVYDEYYHDRIKDRLERKGIKTILGNINNPNDLGSYCIGADGIFHLAAYGNIQNCIKNPGTAYRVNVGGTLAILLMAAECGVKRFVYAGSASAYGKNPRLPWKETAKTQLLNPYSETKYLGELLCHGFGKTRRIQTVCLRFFNVFGSEDAVAGLTDPPCVIERFIALKNSGKEIPIIGDGSQKRDFIHVSDVVRASLAAMLNQKLGRGELINIGSGKNYSVKEIAKSVGGDITHVPWCYEEARDTLADISKARSLLGWEPKITVEKWIKKQLAQL